MRQLQRELSLLRRFVVPAAILIGLFLLVSAPRFYVDLTPAARAYTLAAFGLFFGGVASAAVGALGRAGHRFWPGVRLLNGGAALAAWALYPAEARAPVANGLLVTLALLLLASCWWPAKND